MNQNLGPETLAAAEVEKNNEHLHAGVPCSIDHTDEFLPWDGKFTPPAYRSSRTA